LIFYGAVMKSSQRNSDFVKYKEAEHFIYEAHFSFQLFKSSQWI